MSTIVGFEGADEARGFDVVAAPDAASAHSADCFVLPRIGFGTANLGNLYRAITDEQAADVLEAAWQSGIRYYDTAPHYGLGLSERRLGAFLQTKPRDEFIVSTKVGRLIRANPEGAGTRDVAHDFDVPADRKRVGDQSEAGIRASHAESLERLGLDRVDVLFLHDPEQYEREPHAPEPWERESHDHDVRSPTEAVAEAAVEAYSALSALRDEGAVRAVGTGSMSVDALLQAARTADLDILMIAGRLTLAEQPSLAEVVPAALANGQSIVAAGVFNSGLLAENVPPADARYEYGQAPVEILQRARQIAEICASFGVGLPTAALQYTLRITPVTTVVMGTGRAEQVRQNVERFSERVPEELWEALAAAGLIPR
ncbi:MAG: aldo/keto reductase [Subtercola sp.]|nr:aldo/keto reductase [Subtercola sp.]